MVKVTLKLFATLGDYLPPGSRDNQAEIDVGEGESVGEVLVRLALPARLVHLVLVNGNYLAPAERRLQCLRPGDQLAVWPPVAGG